MGRGSPRLWHAVAALVPIPVVGLGVLVAVAIPTDHTSVEIFLTPKGSEHALAMPSGTAQSVQSFDKSMEPSAGLVHNTKAVTTAGKQLITASLGPNFSGPTPSIAKVSRETKADRLMPTTTHVARSSAGNPLLMNASHDGSMFGPGLDVDAFRPSPEDIAYSPSPDALNFRYKGETQAEFEERERRCLATALYFEARGEPVRGQIAVGQVILNRVRSPNFPETICGVVFQGQHQPGCQFSFACDGRSDTPRNDAQWRLAQDLAKQIMAGEQWLPEVGYSTYFHANYVSPYWRGAMNRIDRIGRHIFYKRRNEKPYIVEASNAVDTAGTEADDSGFLLTPTLSVVSAVSSLAVPSPAPTPAMSLGYAASE